jgi:hypothetical protein
MEECESLQITIAFQWIKIVVPQFINYDIYISKDIGYI